MDNWYDLSKKFGLGTALHALFCPVHGLIGLSIKLGLFAAPALLSFIETINHTAVSIVKPVVTTLFGSAAAPVAHPVADALLLLIAYGPFLYATWRYRDDIHHAFHDVFGHSEDQCQHDH